MKDLFSVSGKVAVVTVGSSGIGAMITQGLVEHGARVYITARKVELLEAIAKEMSALGECVAIPSNLGTMDGVAAFAAAVLEREDKIDILINNAGFALPAAIDSEEYEQSWDSSLDVMATAQAWAIRAALPGLRNSPHPRAVNVASTEAHGATRFNSAYVVAKHASMGLTRAMAVDLGKEGITVNCVCPGPVHTGITQGIPDDHKETFANRRTALRRYADPEEVAHATLSLVLPAASFNTGATLLVDGGVTIRNA